MFSRYRFLKFVEFLKWASVVSGMALMLLFLVPLVVVLWKAFRMGWRFRHKPDYARHHQPRLLFDTAGLADRARRCLVDGHIILCLPRGREVPVCAVWMWLRDFGWSLRFLVKRVAASEMYRRVIREFRRTDRTANGQSWLPYSPDYKFEAVHRG